MPVLPKPPPTMLLAFCPSNLKGFIHMNAASKYLARLYETAIDAGLDTEAIRLYLASRGIARSPAMVRDDLDNVYSFHGYYASHQPASTPCVYAFDRAIDQGRG